MPKKIYKLKKISKKNIDKIKKNSKQEKLIDLSVKILLSLMKDLIYEKNLKKLNIMENVCDRNFHKLKVFF